MKLKKTIKHQMMLAIVLCGFALSANAQKTADYNVIPLPQSITANKQGYFLLRDGVKITYPKSDGKMKNNAEFLAEYVEQIIGLKLRPTAGNARKGAINLTLKESDGNKEGYTMTVSADGVLIEGNSEAGVFYAIQTLRKSLPDGAEGSVRLPYGVIKDAPRFAYRGMMLDCARHYFPVSFVKKYIDILALHNENNFHWHITDDQGWRFEVKRYPQLTAVGSKREETVIGHNSGKYDGKPYGGFYTQDDCREIVAYAAKRYINVVPEIDMPGHMQGALAAFPELGCTGGPYKTWTMWGVSDDVLCAGNPKTVEFIKNVLAELIDVFPSTLIHVGGDECPKTRWASCPKCQAKAKELGITAGKHSAEDQLQSHIIKEAEKFLNANGRQMIGWDETLEGGLAPNAWIMSWRGMEGGIEAAKQHHNVVMTPSQYCYFDHYQSTDLDNEPIAIGGYLPISQVYKFEPVASVLSAEESKYIIGAQANLWTEYIPDGNQVEYMVLPRMAALCETQWMQADKKDYNTFLKHIPHMFALYDKLGYNYAKHLLDASVKFTPNTKENCLDVNMSTTDKAGIYYTLDGTEPSASSSKYTKTLKIKKSCTVKAVAIRGNKASRVFSEKINLSKSALKPIKLLEPPAKGYTYDGAPMLVDGLKGTHNYKTGRWLGFAGKDLVAVIDMQQPTEISTAEIGTCVVTGDWIFGAASFNIEVSDDGETFRPVVSATYAQPNIHIDQNFEQRLSFAPVKARYFKVTVESVKSMPAWHSGAGRSAYLFVDEIQLN